ncbi:hypothetical protein BD413DRAFT_512733 [Trametes elegans]|nr:hypothetical protein BD413DRAFT_512733 [Trametes elegans]
MTHGQSSSLLLTTSTASYPSHPLHFSNSSNSTIIMSGAMQSNVGNSQIYENGDQRNGPSNNQTAQHNLGEQGQRNAHSVFDPKDDRNLEIRAKSEKKHEREVERAERAQTVDDPLEPAQRHGNQPSRGAQVDAELQREDEEILKKKGPYNGSSH